MPRQANSVAHHNPPALSNEPPNHPTLNSNNSLPPLKAWHSVKGPQYPHVAMPGLSIPTLTQPSQIMTKASAQPSGTNGLAHEDYQGDQPRQEPPDLEDPGRTMGRQGWQAPYSHTFANQAPQGYKVTDRHQDCRATSKTSSAQVEPNLNWNQNRPTPQYESKGDYTHNTTTGVKTLKWEGPVIHS